VPDPSGPEGAPAPPAGPGPGASRSRPDASSLVAGAVIVAFGAVLLLDSLGALHLTFAALAPAACAAAGAVLLARGLARGR
jgi:hypothetical protein